MNERRITTANFSQYIPSVIGFDHIANAVNSLASSTLGNSFPPYNITKSTDNDYQLTLAVAGFKRKNIEVTSSDRQLVLSGTVEVSDDEIEYVHRGIALREWTRTFTLAEYVEVNDVSLVDGLLIINLVRNEPDSVKPKIFEIK